MKGKSILLWLVVTIMAVMVFQAIGRYSTPTPKDISYSEFRDEVRKGNVEGIKIYTDRIEGNYVKIADKTKPESFVAQWIGGTTDELSTFLETNHVKDFSFVSKENSAQLKNFLYSFVLPIGGMLLLFFFLMRQIQIGGGKALSFGKSRAKLNEENKIKVTFKDVAGIEEAKEELEEIIDFLRDPKKFTKMGVRIPKGVLLVGAPGTGKTLLARAIAGEAKVPFFSISGSDFVEMFVGVGASRVRDLFEQGKKSAPCIIFIDEIDAVGRQRGAGLGGGHDEREQTLNQLLVEMDGFEMNEGVILIAATNRVDVLDPALLRPGRFDRHVIVSLPDVRGREEILRVHAKKIPMHVDVDLSVLARGTVGFSGADLENLVNEAALLATRLNQTHVTMEHFEKAKDKHMLGKERKSMVMTDEDKKVTAYHEAGHTLIASLSPNADPVHKVTIVPRGMALGVTHQLPERDRYTLGKDEAETMISILMGGRLAEEIVFGTMTNGAANDIERASGLARKMVCEWGMSEEMGPLAYKEHHDQIFLAKEMSNGATLSEKTSQLIDQEIRKIVMRNYEKGKAILLKHRDTLDRLATKLLEKEVLDSIEIKAIIGSPA